MAHAFHSVPLKHQLRRRVLNLAAKLPVRPSHQPVDERILIVRPDHLGDVLLTTPAVVALRAALPDAEIHMLVGPWSAEVIASYPEVDLALTVPFPGFSRSPKKSWRSPYELAWNTARHLRRIGYSSVVIMRPDHWWGALVAHLAGIPQRIGYDLPEVMPFLNQAQRLHTQHVVLQNLQLVEGWTGKLGAAAQRYYFPVDSLDQVYVDGYLQEWGITAGQSVLCIHPGTGTWVKHWPEERWSDVADTLSEQLDLTVVFTGSNTELPLVRRIVDRMKQPAVVMAGDTRVGQLAALFKRARVVLGPDSGPLHLAAAVGAPTVTLFGPADPVEFGPWGTSSRHIVLTSALACRPCRVLDWGVDNPDYHPCLREITVARVLDAARRAAKSA
jgi:lipopolysaccharide heptosyltransferase II